MNAPAATLGATALRSTAGAAGAVLDVQGLGKAFTLHTRGGQRRQVLRDVNLHVARGECVALVGPSGRGKSTLIKCLHGSYGADAGAMWLHADGAVIDLAQASPRDWLALRRRDISYVSQFLRVLPRVSALDVVAERVLDARVPAPDGGSPEREQRAQHRARERAAELLQRLNLPAELWGLPPATFSGGEQQRVNLARAFVEPARLLLLDEPTASLDRANRQVVVDLVRQACAAGTAVVGIFHDEEVRAAVASRSVVL